MLDYFLISCLLLYAEGRPNDRRFRRDDDVAGVIYAPCKDTYSQCPEWQKSGMCEMPQYKDYMPLVCTDTCGFCKVKGEDTGNVATAAAATVANKDIQETTKIDWSSDTAQKDKIQEDYEAQLKKYYQNLESQQKEYQAAIQPQPQPAPSNTESGTSNSGVSTPPSVDVSPSVSAESTTMQPGTYLAYLPYQSYGSQTYDSQTYGSQPYPAYPYPPPEGSSSSSSSTSSGASSSSSSSTDTSSGSSISVGFVPPSSLNGTEGNISASTSEVAVLPSKVAPETPSLPALPPLLALPPISESLLVEDSSKSNNNTNPAVEKETDDNQKAQQVADSKPYAPERTSSSSSKKERKKQMHKSLLKTDSDRKIITEDQQTNEMTKSESKHLTAIAREPNLEDENNDDEIEDEEEEEGDQKMIKAFSNNPGKLQLNKLNIKKKNLDTDLNVSKQERAQEKSEKEKTFENEDAVFKHDEKSVSDGGSGALGLEESVEDLNYITDFNPDDFDMDVADISRKDLIRLHDKRNSVQFPENHPLFSRSGIQKARSEITAPTIIDATEEGVGDSNVADTKINRNTKAHPKLKSSTKPAKKEEVSKKEESSGMPSEVQSKFFESTSGGEQEDDDTEDVNVEDAEKKNNIKEDTKTKDKGRKNTYEKNKVKKKSTRKNKIKKTGNKTGEISKRKDKVSKHENSDNQAEKKSIANTKVKPTIGMKSKISINFKKSETIHHEKSKVISTKNKIEEKKDKNSGKNEYKKEKSEVNEFMSEKGDTAAVRNKEVVKKSSAAAVTKKERRHEDIPLLSRKEIPEAPTKSREALKKRTNDDDKVEETEATIADLSGAGSDEIDTDMLSGDSPSRSLVESGDDDGDDEDDDDNEGFAHQRQNFQLHGDPEMVDLKPKETAEQPDLDDFPDKDDKSSYTKGKNDGQKDVDKKNMSDDGPELDDKKIEELLNPKQEEKKKKKEANKETTSSKLKEGKISLVLQQNFNVLYEKRESPSYQMLSGNIKKDIEKMITGVIVNDVTFSEVSVEGNPRQSGKTKANFNIKARTNEWMKELLKLVDSGDIDGLRVIKGSLEIEEE